MKKRKKGEKAHKSPNKESFLIGNADIKAVIKDTNLN